LLATGSADAIIKIWSLTDHSCVKQLEGHDCSVLKLHWISDTQIFSSASDGLVKVRVAHKS
jgi:U3 small nucleolar RNA-associated protein 13